jgi:hypothetical protein
MPMRTGSIRSPTGPAPTNAPTACSPSAKRSSTATSPPTTANDTADAQRRRHAATARRTARTAAGTDGHGAGTRSGTGGGSLVEAVTTRQLTPTARPAAPAGPPRPARRSPATRAVVVVDIAHLTGDDTPAGRAARLLWRLHGAPPALTTAGVERLCDDADLQLLLTDGHTILGITAPTPTIPTRLREAVYARDQGCRFTGCRAPVAWCDLHHVTAREDGGHTIITNLVALCRRHHTAITTGRWTLSMTDDGTVTLRRGRIVHTTDPPLHLTLAPD